MNKSKPNKDSILRWELAGAPSSVEMQPAKDGDYVEAKDFNRAVVLLSQLVSRFDDMRMVKNLPQSELSVEVRAFITKALEFA